MTLSYVFLCLQDMWLAGCRWHGSEELLIYDLHTYVSKYHALHSLLTKTMMLSIKFWFVLIPRFHCALFLLVSFCQTVFNHAFLGYAAFGNAKTNKNDNSSRFVSAYIIIMLVKQQSRHVLSLMLPQGKYMDIEFDFKGDPVGGIISKCEWNLYNTEKKYQCFFPPNLTGAQIFLKR